MCFSGFKDGFVCSSLHECVSLDSKTGSCVRLCVNVFLWIHRRVRVRSSLHECVSLDSQTGSCVFVSA